VVVVVVVLLVLIVVVVVVGVSICVVVVLSWSWGVSVMLVPRRAGILVVVVVLVWAMIVVGGVCVAVVEVVSGRVVVLPYVVLEHPAVRFFCLREAALLRNRVFVVVSLLFLVVVGVKVWHITMIQLIDFVELVDISQEKSWKSVMRVVSRRSTRVVITIKIRAPRFVIMGARHWQMTVDSVNVDVGVKW
jgi:hypothetical protein